MFRYILASFFVVFCGVQYQVITKLGKLQAEINSLNVDTVKDGAWTEWGEWSLCSASSNDGLRSRSRSCTDPAPSLIGKYCEGDSSQYKLCSQNLFTDQLPRRRFNIAFTAYLSVTVTKLSHRQVIPFDKVILNEGQGFNVNTHIFTCPVTGTYNFQISVLCVANSVVVTEIVKEGDTLVQAHSQPAPYRHAQGFNSVFTKCEKGENVWVRLHVGNSIYGDRYSTFSGLLLWENK